MIHSSRRTIFWRLFWKEYRVQRAFWLCIAVLAVLLTLLPRFTVAVSNERLHWQFTVALFLPVLYAAACGAMLFATEHEAGTYEFQRSLPLRPAELLLGKFAFALCGVVVLCAVSWSFAAVLSGLPIGEAFRGPADWARRAALYHQWIHYPPLESAFVCLEVFLWTVLFSLLLRRPLAAAIFGGAAVAATVAYVRVYQAPSSAAMPQRLAIVFALAAADVWLGLRWLGERRAAPMRRSFSQRPSANASDLLRAPSAARSVGRLVWEYWRQSRGMYIALAALFVPSAMMFSGPGPLALLGGAVNWFDIFDTAAWALALAAFALAGAVTFHGDQQGCSYRFLADRGVRPDHVWLSRQLPVWIGSALLVAVLSALAAKFGLLGAAHSSRPQDADQVVKNVIVGVVSVALLGVAAGQFCSMLFRNGFLAAFFALLFSTVLALWYGLTRLWGVPWSWSVLPIPLALLLATRLRTPNWLVERNALRAWLPVALTLLLPAAAILTAVPLYRAYQIPAVDPGFSPEEFARPLTKEEQATCDLYEKAYRSLNHSYSLPKTTDDNQESGYKNGRRVLRRSDVARVDNNSKAIAMTLEASRKADCNLVNPKQPESESAYRYAEDLADLVLCSAMRVEEQGDLDAAFERYLAVVRIAAQLRQGASARWWPTADQIEKVVYDRLPYWAARSRQTPERIVDAARRLDDLTSELPPDSASVKREYLSLHRALSGGYAEIIQGQGGTEVALWQLTAVWSRLPWERTRALRLLDVLTRNQLDELAAAQAAAEGGKAVPQPPYQRADFSEDYSPFEAKELPYALHREVHVPPIQGPLPYEQAERIRRYTVLLALRRGARLSLVLEAWKLRHGSLPKSIAVFAKPYFGRELIDPFTGVPFRFAREGVGIPVRWRCYGLDYPVDGEIAANVPFVWSAGPRVIFKGGTGQLEPDFSYYEILDDRWRSDPHKHRADSNYDLWQAGLPVPVP